VQVEDVREHRMHKERFVVPEATASKIGAARRVIAVGTTTVRVLESVADKDGRVPAGSGETDIFIRPPHAFRVVDALLTNFHFPESTLLMLVSAFADRELMLAAYRDAVRERYRFFSYGDCMLIL
jgi:S-adenosylmethionine:tRNA ribosyltransferase-isomerase